MTSLQFLRWIRRVVIFVVGFSVVGVGLLLIVTPGPAILVVPAGLALLATEFAWARRLLQRLKRQIDLMRERGSQKPQPPGTPPEPPQEAPAETPPAPPVQG